MHFVSAGNTPLTEAQIMRFRRFTELGDELHELYVQTAQIRQDFVTYKSKNQRRLEHRREMHSLSTQKLYKSLCRVVPWGGCLRPLWNELDEALCSCPITGHIHAVVLDGEHFCTLRLSHRWGHIPLWHFSTAVPHLDSCLNATEGDLAFIIAVAKRWQQLAADVMGVDSYRHRDTGCRRVVKAAEQLEEEAMQQLNTWLDSSE